MFSPTTGLQVAGHDAWLAEMRKEPSPEIGPVAKARRRRRWNRAVASALAGWIERMGPQRREEPSQASEAPAQATGARI